MSKTTIAVLAALSLAACATSPQPAETAPEPMNAAAASGGGAPAITAEAIEAHMRFLADDLLEGRGTGERGYDLAALYVETQFRLAGLEPGGSNGYRDPVPLVELALDREGAAMAIDGEALSLGEDFLVSPHPTREASTAEGEAVFVNFGVHAPDAGWDDFAGVDLEGRIAVVLNGAPDGVFGSDVAAHLSSTRTKLQELERRGAAGAVFVPVEGLTRWTFDRLARRAADGRPSLTVPAASGGAGLEAWATLSPDAAARLIPDFDAVVAAAEAGEPTPPAVLDARVRISQASTREPVISDNVVGVLPGRDPAFAGEPVIVTAHLDHLGVCRLETEEDRICNGAMDNASGTAVMLETARAMAEAGAPKRPVVFVALTAEERGLLGAAHIAANPPPAMRGMVANVNLDMPVLLYEFEDMLAFGAEHSALGPLASAAAEAEGLSISPDPIPEQSLFVRSDHYEFVRQGVPAIFLMTGFTSPDPEADDGQAFMGFLGSPYHQPGDDLSQPIRYDMAAVFARVNQAIIREVADAETAPTWNEDSFFAGLAR